MGSDCTVEIDEGFINVRVGAIIMKDGKFLMAGNDKDDFLYSVGGRVKFGETSEQAVMREVFEETGVKMDIERLGFIHENFFTADYGLRKDRLMYEISFFYYMKVPDGFEPVCDTFTENGQKEKLVWVDKDSKIKYFPEFFGIELYAQTQGVKHIVTDERKGLCQGL